MKIKIEKEKRFTKTYKLKESTIKKLEMLAKKKLLPLL